MSVQQFEEPRIFVSTLPARSFDRRLALVVVALSALVFIGLAPFAKVKLPPVWAFIPIYQSALVVTDFITAVLLFSQFRILQTRGLLLLASGYLFTGLMATVHALTFPGLFAEGGLLGAGGQSTAWLYMAWHGGFPLLVICYALMRGRDSRAQATRGSSGGAVAGSVVATFAVALGFAVIATAGHELLPPIMRGHGYTPVMLFVVSSVWALSLAALLLLWMRRPHSVLDLWLIVVMCAWLFDIALSAVLNAGRFDLGFYAGRVYGLVATSFVLVMLLLETGALYGELARLLQYERRQSATEIWNINAKLATLLDSSPLPVFSLDLGGRVDTWNPAAEHVFGHTATEVTGRDFVSLPENLDGSDLHRRVIAGEPVRNAAMRWRRADGQTLEIVCSAAPVRDANGGIQAGVYVAEDVTARRKLERQLAQSQRLEAVGQLTGGIAHDFNNLLTVVIGNLDMQLELLRDSPSRADEAERLAGDALNAAMRGAELVRRLLAFSRRQPLEPQLIEVRRLVRDLTPLLRRTLGEHVTVRADASADLWPVLADASQLEAAILNLAINARDAMPRGGALSLTCTNVTHDASAAAQAELNAGDYVSITVADTGTGIPADILPRVFEPFFTTKGAERGNGLGLSMVYGFARQSGGAATIYSEPGRGTEVRIYLPRGIGASGALAPAVISETVTPRGRERILVVEDKADVRRIAAYLLQSLGYRTEAVENAAAALALLDRGEAFDLLFTDIIMPGMMTGIDLAREVRRRSPHMPIVFASGFSNPETTVSQIAALSATVISKPYSKARVGAHLRMVLDRAGAQDRAAAAG
jgi:PAS domain S-box-containing protein